MDPDHHKLQKLRMEKTLVIIKPDGVLRKLVGELLNRFERKGLKIVAMKMIWPSKELVEQHYTDSEEWLESNGNRTFKAYVDKGITPKLTPREFALRTRNKLISGMTAGPVVAFVLEGAHAVQLVRKMRGATSPLLADVGTIGFDYSMDSYEVSDLGDWATRNIIHASDPETAENEIKLWFKEDEIMNYDSPLDSILYSKDWKVKRD